jgi:hypothetical protein
MPAGVSRPWVLAAVAVLGVTGAATLLKAEGGRLRKDEGGKMKAEGPGARPIHPSSVIRHPSKEPPSGEVSFDRYQELLRRNVFAPRVKPRTEPSIVVTPAPGPPGPLPPVTGPPAPEKPAEPVKPAPPPPPDPLGDWAYSGTVILGDEVYAVMENRTSKQGVYVREGQPFAGGTVQRIAQGAVVLALGGATRTMSKSTAFNATPLDAPAASGQPQGGPGGPGTPQPGAPHVGGPSRPGQPAPGAPMPGSPVPMGTVVVKPEGGMPAGQPPASRAPIIIRN